MATTASSAQITAQLTLTRPGFTLDVDLQLPGRGVTALFGPSGCGKTTCLRAIAGLERAQPGRVEVNGEVWQDDAQTIWRATHERGLGYVFQEASLFDHLSVRGNIDYGLKRTPPARRKVALEQAVDLLGIAPLMDRKPQALSGGERQRVAIARALATSPRLLLMDEPLAALDAARKAEILPWLEQLHQKLDIPVVYVTHSADEVARLADHVVLLEQGRVLAQGPVLELMTRADLPLAHGDSAGALVEAVTCGLQSDSDLCELRFDGGTLLLPQTRATPLPDRTPVRVRIQARDVSLSLVQPEQTSVLNCLPATVVDVSEDGPGQVLVGLRLGQDTRLLSRISRLSCERLGIAPGMAVYAQIKGVAMVR